MVMEKLGAFVRKERKARKINLREMAMMIRVAPIRLSKVERDMLDRPKTRYIRSRTSLSATLTFFWRGRGGCHHR